MAGSPLLPRRASPHPHLLQLGGGKGATVLTKIFVVGKNPDVEPQDIVSGRWSDFNQGNPDPGPQLKCDPISGYDYFEYVGRLHELPLVLDGLAIVQVVLDYRGSINLANVRDQGRYESREAFGYVEHTISWNRERVTDLTQYITVTGETLEAANRLMDAIISHGIQPVTVTVPKPRPTLGERIKSLLRGFDLRREPFCG